MIEASAIAAPSVPVQAPYVVHPAREAEVGTARSTPSTANEDATTASRAAEPTTSAAKVEFTVPNESPDPEEFVDVEARTRPVSVGEGSDAAAPTGVLGLGSGSA